jgi:hypothetical protein
MTNFRTPTDEELLEKAYEIRRSVRTRADRIKEQLCHWMAQNIGRADAVPASVAFLELAIEIRHGKESPDETLDYITRTFHHLTHARSSRLQ